METKNIEIQAVVWKYSKRKGYNHKMLADACGIKKGTLDHKITKPETFRIGELRLIFDVLGVPKEERVGL